MSNNEVDAVATSHMYMILLSVGRLILHCDNTAVITLPWLPYHVPLHGNLY